jgi:hypothetical protein
MAGGKYRKVGLSEGSMILKGRSAIFNKAGLKFFFTQLILPQ